MKKLIIFICTAGLLAFSSTDILAQDTRFGIKGGVTMYKGTFEFMGAELSTDSKLGFTGGIFVEFPLSDLISIQPEVQFIQKNTEDSGGTFGTNGSGSETSSSTISYVDVPILLKINIPLEGNVRPYVAGGGYAGYLIDAKAETGGASEDISEFMNDLNYGVLVGAGVNLGNFNIEFRYDIGLGNIYDFDDDLFGSGDFSATLSGFSLTAGVSF